LEARSQRVNPDVGPVGRSVVDEEGPIKARGRVNTSTGRPKREAEAVTEDEVLESRGRFGSKVERDIGFPAGGSTSDSSDSGGSTGIKFNSPGGHRREAEPIRISGSRGSHRREAEPIRISGSRGGHRREAKTVDQSMKNAGGGPKRRDAAAQPGRLDIGKGHDRRDADAKAIEARQRMSSGTGRGRRRDAIPGFVRPGGGTRPRDVTAETVEARTRLRGNSHRV